MKMVGVPVTPFATPIGKILVDAGAHALAFQVARQALHVEADRAGCLEHVFLRQRRWPLIERVVHLPEAPLQGGGLGRPGGELGPGVSPFVGKLTVDVGQALAHRVTEALDDVAEAAAIGAEIVAKHQHRRRAVATPARVVAARVDRALERELDAGSGHSDVAGDRPHLGRGVVAQVEEDLVHVAPSPALRRIVALDDRVAGGVEMRGGVAVG
jgi:hypothetical protein